MSMTRSTERADGGDLGVAFFGGGIRRAEVRRRFRIVPTYGRPYVLHLARRELGQRGGVGVEWDDEGSVRVPGPAKATRPVSVPRVHGAKAVHERAARLAPRRLFFNRRRLCNATRLKRVDDRAQGHAAAVRERGVGWEQGGAQTHACLKKYFGMRDVARRGGESRRVAGRDPGISRYL